MKPKKPLSLNQPQKNILQTITLFLVCLVFLPSAGAQPIATRWIAYNGPGDTLAVSQDGQWLATGSRDKNVRLWDAATGTLRQELPGHQSWVTVLAFSPDSSRLASGSRDQAIRIWDVADGLTHYTLWHADNTVTGLAFLSDDVLISGDLDGLLWIGNFVTGEEIYRTQLESSIRSLALSPDHSLLAIGLDNGAIELLDLNNLEDENATVRLEGHRGAITDLNFSPDLKLLISASADKSMRSWDIRNAFDNAFIPRIVIPVPMQVMDVAVSLRGEIVSGALDGTIRVHNRFGTEMQTESHDAPLTNLVLRPDGKLVTLDSGGHMQMWTMGNPDIVLDWTTTITPDITVAIQPAASSVGIEIPSVNIQSSLTSFPLGATTWEIDPWEHLVGHMEGTATLAMNGNVVLGGHSELPTGAPGIFYDLYETALGDEIYVQDDGIQKRYVITEIRTVKFNDVSVVYPTEDSRVTLITCNIPTYGGNGFYDERLIVIGSEIPEPL